MSNDNKKYNSSNMGEDELISIGDSTIYDFDTERLVTAFIIEGHGTEQDILPFLSEQSFLHPTCREIYRAAAAVSAAGTQVDIMSIATQLKKNGSELTCYDVGDMYQLMRLPLVYTNPIPLAKHLRELEHRRKLVNMSYALADLAQDGEITLQQINDRLQEFINKTPADVEMTTVGTAADKVCEIMEQNMSEDNIIGTRTGFTRIDNLGGLHCGDLIVVAGDTSHGKTSFALTITDNAIANGNKIAYYSLEMSDFELTARILAFRTGINVTTQLYQHSAPYERELISEAAKLLPRENLLFDDRATADFDSILTSIRSLHKTQGIDGAVVDYIQILNVNEKRKDTQEQLMAQVARKLKNLAKELNIWIMALSQLNRNMFNPEPSLSRLRDSGQIAEAADVVILIYRPELYGKTYSGDFALKTTQGTAQIEIAKGRNIGLMKFLVRFKAELTYFYEGDIDDLPPEQQQEQQKGKNNQVLTRTQEEDMPF